MSIKEIRCKGVQSVLKIMISERSTQLIIVVQSPLL